MREHEWGGITSEGYVDVTNEGWTDLGDEGFGGHIQGWGGD